MKTFPWAAGLFALGLFGFSTTPTCSQKAEEPKHDQIGSDKKPAHTLQAQQLLSKPKKWL